MHTGKTIDLLCDRETYSMEQWLKNHLQVTLVSRDRSTNYSSAIAMSGRKIEEVADRFHLVKNMSDCVDRIICTNYNKIVLPGKTSNMKPNSYLQEIFKAIKELERENMSISSIAKIVGVARQTVRKYISYKELPPRSSSPRNHYFPYEDYVFAEQSKGKSLHKIYHEIKEMGFSGSRTPFYDYFKKRKETYGKQVSLPPLKISSFICGTRIRCLSKEEKHILQSLFHTNKWLRELTYYMKLFHEIIMGKKPQTLTNWIKRAKSLGIKKLNSFIYGIEKDIHAIENAIKLQWNNGIVEGHINRLKSIKRQMYGRAGIELLKRKVILSKYG